VLSKHTQLPGHPWDTCAQRSVSFPPTRPIHNAYNEYADGVADASDAVVVESGLQRGVECEFDGCRKDAAPWGKVCLIAMRSGKFLGDPIKS